MKVAIIGAGANGLYLAWKLSKMGHQVAVFEKNKSIGNKVCSGLFSERILDFIPEAKGLIQNEINYVLIHFPKKTVRLDFSKRFLIMNHSELDKLLADLAQNAGAKILLNNKISELPAGFDRIIGCDGADSFVRDYLKLEKPKQRIGIRGFVIEECHKDFVEAWPCEGGFSWAIPRGNSIEYGTMANAHLAYRIFTDFIKTYGGEKITDVKARMIPQGLPALKDKTITLCGDASGLTKPWSGGGVIWGLMAADMILATFPNFNVYHDRMKRFFGRKIWTSKKLTKAVYFFGFHLPWFLPRRIRVDSDFIF